jgi:hypothetical protein
MQNSKDSPPRWFALIQDRVVLLPRQILTALTIKEQAVVGPDYVLIRDYQSPSDVTFGDNNEVNLAQGNVFRIANRCQPVTCQTVPDALPKLAFLVDDRVTTTPQAKQTEDSLRRLFNLGPEVELLRDMESPDDKPIATDEQIHFKDGPVFLTCVDMGKHCGSCPLPHARRYIIRVDDKRAVVDKAKVTGREILVLAGFDPAVTMLNQKVGKRFEPVPLDKLVDLTACGVERFTTLPNEQSEGRPAMRRQVALPEEDVDLLDGSDLVWETITDSQGRWLLIRDIPLREVFVSEPTSVAIQIPSGYPSTALDMAYFSPPIRRKDGSTIPCTEATQVVDGSSWQRWSRHYTPANPWKVGAYNVFTHYLLSQSWLEREAHRGITA